LRDSKLGGAIPPLPIIGGGPYGIPIGDGVVKLNVEPILVVGGHNAIPALEANRIGRRGLNGHESYHETKVSELHRIPKQKVLLLNNVSAFFFCMFLAERETSLCS
jgi:hypothetical protein